MYRCRAERLRAAAILLLLASAGACRPRQHARSLDDDGRLFVRLAVALGEHDPASLDYYAGPPDLHTDVRAHLPPLTTVRLESLTAAERIEMDEQANAERARALSRDFRAIALRVEVLQGAKLPYAEEAKRFFGLQPPARDTGRWAGIRDRIARLLGGSGPLADRYAAFTRRFLVPRERLAAVLDAAIDECRTRTLARLTLPAGERVQVEFVHDRPWSAYSRYRGGGRSTIEINTDFQFTIDQALQVACHEAYPGHHTRTLLLNDDGARGFSRASARSSAFPERQVQLTFSRESLASESSAMAAPGVAFTEGDRVRVEHDRLRPLAELGDVDVGRHVAVETLVGELQQAQAAIAADYLDGRLEFERAVQALERDALVPHAEPLVKYINQYRSYVSVYTDGARLFAGRLAACGGGSADERRRWECFREALLNSEPSPVHPVSQTPPAARGRPAASCDGC